MCYDYELEYLMRRAEEARKESKKAEERAKEKSTEEPKPSGQEEPVPV
jgi:hypothetical protein